MSDAFIPDYIKWIESLMAEWLQQASQWHGVYRHDLEVMGLNPGWVELGVRSTAVQIIL